MNADELIRNIVDNIQRQEAQLCDEFRRQKKSERKRACVRLSCEDESVDIVLQDQGLSIQTEPSLKTEPDLWLRFDGLGLRTELASQLAKKDLPTLPLVGELAEALVQNKISGTLNVLRADAGDEPIGAVAFAFGYAEFPTSTMFSINAPFEVLGSLESMQSPAQLLSDPRIKLEGDYATVMMLLMQ